MGFNLDYAELGPLSHGVLPRGKGLEEERGKIYYTRVRGLNV